MSNGSRAPGGAKIPPPGPQGAPPGSRWNWQASFRPESFNTDWNFVRRVLIVVLIVGLAYFFWLIGRVLLLVFAAILLAVVLRAFADLLASRTPIPRRWSLTAAVAVVALLFVAFVALFGAQIAGQTEALVEGLPEALDQIGARFDIMNASEQVGAAIQPSIGGDIFSRIAGIGYTVLGVLADLVLVIIAAIYLAADANTYRHGAAKLFPETQHARIYGAFDATGIALRLWFAGQLVSMALVGIAAGLAFWWIGLPTPLALGIIAGVTNFIPFVGPILGSIPALIFAATLSASAVLWTLVAILVIQQIEGNIIMPLVQKRAVSMPPALALFAILVFGLIFGFLGVFLAVPLTVALMVAVKKLWIRETLGEETSLPGEDKHDQAEESAAAPG